MKFLVLLLMLSIVFDKFSGLRRALLFFSRHPGTQASPRDLQLFFNMRTILFLGLTWRKA
jgi:hypothetical protein